MSLISIRICVQYLVAVRRSCREKKMGYRHTDSWHEWLQDNFYGGSATKRIVIKEPSLRLLFCAPVINTSIHYRIESSESVGYHTCCMTSVPQIGGAVAEWVRDFLRALEWRPGGPGVECCCGDFASELC